METALTVFTLILFVFWRIYWLVTGKKADKEKPRQEEKGNAFTWKRLQKYSVYIFSVVILLQLLGWQIWPMPSSQWVPLFGFCLVVLGIGVAVAARYELGTNWANAYEYQVKKKQQLVTTGIYAYVRNPIYSGLVVAVIGAELVVQSYLFIVCLVLVYGVYKQSKLEEKILEEHFGKEYTNYKKRSKMLIPFVF